MSFEFLLKKIFILLFICPLSTFAQNKTFVGFIELENKTYIDIRVTFDIKGEKVEGYTISDYNGPHESKSSIIGKYDSSDGKISFREVDILYSKSPVTKLDFCYIYFEGNLSKNKLDGAFKGYYDDLEKCLNGKIFSTKLEKAEKRKKKLLKKVNRLVKDELERDRISKRIESIKLSDRKGIGANENVNVFWTESYLKVFIWDAGNVDNDQIEIKQNDTIRTIINPKKQPIILEYYLSGEKNVISVKATSEGFDPPNTTKIKFTNGKGRKIELIYNLKLDEEATLTFYKKKLSELKAEN